MFTLWLLLFHIWLLLDVIAINSVHFVLMLYVIILMYRLCLLFDWYGLILFEILMISLCQFWYLLTTERFNPIAWFISRYAAWPRFLLQNLSTLPGVIFKSFNLWTQAQPLNPNRLIDFGALPLCRFAVPATYYITF